MRGYKEILRAYAAAFSMLVAAAAVAAGCILAMENTVFISEGVKSAQVTLNEIVNAALKFFYDSASSPATSFTCAVRFTLMA